VYTYCFVVIIIINIRQRRYVSLLTSHMVKQVIDHCWIYYPLYKYASDTMYVVNM